MWADGNESYNFSNVGGIVGFDEGDKARSINNCQNHANLDIDFHDSNMYGVGGIAGECYSLGIIQNSANTGNVTCNATLAGGIVGELTSSTINNCINEGNVKGIYQIGGISGHILSINNNNNNKAKINGSKNKGEIETTGYVVEEGIILGKQEKWNSSSVGGITGESFFGEIAKCINEGGIKATGYEVAGGIAGYCKKDSVIRQCANYANIECNNERVLGGIVGYVYQGIVEECFNNGSVKGKELIGGILGQSTKSTIRNCYNTASISGNIIVGGIIGDVSPYKPEKGHEYLYNCYNIGEIRATKIKDCWVGNSNYLEYDHIYTTKAIHDIVGDGTWYNEQGNKNYEAIDGTDAEIKTKMLTNLLKENGTNKWTRDSRNNGYPYLIDNQP